MKKKLLGIVSRPKGLDGTIVIEKAPFDLPELVEHCKIYIGFSDKFTKEFTLVSWRQNKRTASIKLLELTEPEQIEEFREKGLFADESSFIYDEEVINYGGELFDFNVVDGDTKTILGKVTDYLTMPANDIIAFDYNGKEVLIPYVPEFVTKINKKQKIVVVHLIEGLLDL